MKSYLFMYRMKRNTCLSKVLSIPPFIFTPLFLFLSLPVLHKHLCYQQLILSTCHFLNTLHNVIELALLYMNHCKFPKVFRRVVAGLDNKCRAKYFRITSCLFWRALLEKSRRFFSTERTTHQEADVFKIKLYSHFLKLSYCIFGFFEKNTNH